ncbi:zinc ribbon domain-containing protein [Clostridium cellulovorans]|uniref:DZANK-type domain-containing protein n=1 Tax=Clostridium cellulovorans (strain ATCC 35296 / DSM 3052 / OCM 3 / 743B) TaxID=573061 RepID=D9SQN3_CLOC7|nr:zinc ribbon domain-containing protein [Clostridium cellulovorans]ADL52239.1 hypothetical protein Clocel_2527 [Clostridium cellulovorans 743B]
MSFSISSFFSGSSSGHYRHGHYGGNHYRKKGVLGSLLEVIASRSWSSSGFGHHHHHVVKPVHTVHTVHTVHNEPAQRQNMTVCNRCNSQIPAGSKFCLQCGEKVQGSAFCMECGEKLPANAKFCLNCGKKINS